MTGMNKGAMGRQAALAAVERIKRLLELAEHDPQAQEILAAAKESAPQPDPQLAKQQNAPVHTESQPLCQNAKSGALGPSYFAAKRRHFDQLRMDAQRRLRPCGEN